MWGGGLGRLFSLTSFIRTMFDIPGELPIPSSSLSSYFESFIGEVEGVVVGSFFSMNSLRRRGGRLDTEHEGSMKDRTSSPWVVV